MLETIISYDEQLLAWFNAFLIPQDVVAIAAEIHWVLVLMLLVWLWLVGVWRKNPSLKDASLHIFWSVCLWFLVAYILNLILPMRPRPEDVEGVNFLLEHTPDNSFPSTHAIFTWASIMTIRWVLNRAWAIWFLITGLIMVLARIVAGIHFPTDIAAGLLIWFGVWGIHLMLSDWKIYVEYGLTRPKKLASFFRL